MIRTRNFVHRRPGTIKIDRYVGQLGHSKKEIARKTIYKKKKMYYFTKTVHRVTQIHELYFLIRRIRLIRLLAIFTSSQTSKNAN